MIIERKNKKRGLKIDEQREFTKCAQSSTTNSYVIHGILFDDGHAHIDDVNFFQHASFVAFLLI